MGVHSDFTVDSRSEQALMQPYSLLRLDCNAAAESSAQSRKLGVSVRLQSRREHESIKGSAQRIEPFCILLLAIFQMTNPFQ